MKSRTSTLPRAARPPGLAARIAAWARIARSFTYFAVAMLWLVLPLGLGQRLTLWPLTALFPRRRDTMLQRWIQFHARVVMRLARIIAGIRVRRHGALAPGASVVLMNHQSVLDVPALYAMVPRPLLLVPTRDRYAHTVPGVSFLLRLARMPLVTQKRERAAADLEQIARAADRVAAGKASIGIYPEGHRTRDGEIGPFMQRGLLAILRRAPGVPVYCVVGDGMWGARTMAEAAYRMAGARIDLVVLGPFAAPADAAAIPAFIDSLRDRMVDALARLRRGEAA